MNNNIKELSEILAKRIYSHSVMTKADIRAITLRTLTEYKNLINESQGTKRILRED